MWRSLARFEPAQRPVSVDGPLVGVKYAAVVAIDGELRFCGTTARSRHSRCYDTDAIATCQQGHDHRPPAWSCTCGFYAHATDRQLEVSWGDLRRPYWAHLVVELSGRVVEHERGWRASRQVVLEASWEDCCETCTVRPADGFGPSERLPGAVVPRCRPCARDGWMSVGDVAGQLGTDVRLVHAADRPAPTVPPIDATRRPWARQLLTRSGVLALAGVVATGLLALGSGDPHAPVVDPVETVRSQVDVWSPQETAALVAAAFDGHRQRAVVLADGGTTAFGAAADPVGSPAPATTAPTARSARAADVVAVATVVDLPRVEGQDLDRSARGAGARARLPMVSAVVLSEEPSEAVAGRCRILLVRPAVPPSDWQVVDLGERTHDACMTEATRARTPRPVEPAGPPTAPAATPTTTAAATPTSAAVPTPTSAAVPTSATATATAR